MKHGNLGFDVNDTPKCGAILFSPDICRNETLWQGVPCGPGGRRCEGWWPGQCDTGTGCRDGSHLATEQDTDDMCLVGGDTMVPISDVSDPWKCQDKFRNDINL